MPGAAILSAQAALRCGVGTLCLASVPSTCDKLIATTPEAMLLPLPMATSGTISVDALPTLLTYAKQCSAVLIGCGLGQSPDTTALVRGLLTTLDCPIILDADGLNVTAPDIRLYHEAATPLILTPHPAEMGRLLGCATTDVQNDRVGSILALCSQSPKLTVALKGAGTLIGSSTRGIRRNPTGNSGMSKGGSGDVLAGMIGALVAQGIPPYESACLGVFLHGYAGDLAAKTYSQTAMLPSDLIQMLPSVFCTLEKKG